MVAVAFAADKQRKRRHDCRIVGTEGKRRLFRHRCETEKDVNGTEEYLVRHVHTNQNVP